MTRHHTRLGAGSSEDVHNIVGAALFALGQGAKGALIQLSAVEAFRGQFTEQVRTAIEQPDWRAHWQQEEVYLVAVASEMGRKAARLAAEERRRFITPQDLDRAMAKSRGHLPVAGRWCPV